MKLKLLKRKPGEGRKSLARRQTELYHKWLGQFPKKSPYRSPEHKRIADDWAARRVREYTAWVHAGRPGGPVVKGPRIVVLGRYQSGSSPDTVHVVTREGTGPVICTCRGYRHHGKCWHVSNHQPK